jgi:hypothetical protein
VTSAEGRGPRVKPTIETAGDIAYGGRRRAAVTAALRELQRRIDQYNAAIDREVRRLQDERARAAAQPTTTSAAHDFFWARAWIKNHGGTVPAALKQTHPDTGGNAQDFQFTQKAREILKRQRPT